MNLQYYIPNPAAQNMSIIGSPDFYLAHPYILWNILKNIICSPLFNICLTQFYILNKNLLKLLLTNIQEFSFWLFVLSLFSTDTMINDVILVFRNGRISEPSLIWKIFQIIIERWILLKVFFFFAYFHFYQRKSHCFSRIFLLFYFNNLFITRKRILSSPNLTKIN